MNRVLVIEDNADVREGIGTILESAGYEVVCAAEGRCGLELQRERPADVVITDIFMPEADGIETIQRLRAEFPSIKIIAISGGGAFHKSMDYLTTARRLGAHCVLRKPFDAVTLLESVSALLRAPVGAPGSPATTP